MNKYKYGNVSQPDIYLDETVTRMCYTHRRLLATLAMSLINEGKTEKASEGSFPPSCGRGKGGRKG